MNTGDEVPSGSNARDSADRIDVRQITARLSSFSLADRANAFGPWRALRGHRIVLASLLAGIAWLPLVVLVLAERAGGAIGALSSLLRDYAVHVRTLFAIPLMILIEPFVDRRVRGTTRGFIECSLMKRSDLPVFERSIDLAERLRDAKWIPWLLFALAIAGSAFSGSQRIAVRDAGWSAMGAGASRRLTPAGWWYLAVGVPMFQYLTLRWFWRWFIWTRLLWRIAGVNLKLRATHADRVAGLGFLGYSASSFAFVIVGPSAVVTTAWVGRVLNNHEVPSHFVGPALGLVLLELLFVFVPLLTFWRHLRRVQHDDAARYGALVQKYIRRFDRLWIDTDADDDALAALDAQNMADLANVYDIVAHTRFLPFEPIALMELGAAVLIPLLPLLAASSSPVDILKKIAGAMF